MEKKLPISIKSLSVLGVLDNFFSVLWVVIDIVSWACLIYEVVARVQAAFWEVVE